MRIEFRPLRHAVDILGPNLGRQALNLHPVPALGLIDLPYNGKSPVRERCMRRRPRRKHGEAALQILSRRESSALVTGLAAAAKPARDESFTHMITSCSPFFQN